MSDKSRKLDIILEASKEYNLKETEDPEIYTMLLGNGYTLNVRVDAPWTISLDNESEPIEYPVYSESVPYTNREDAESLWAKVTLADPSLKWSGESIDADAQVKVDTYAQDDVDKKLIAALVALMGPGA